MKDKMKMIEELDEKMTRLIGGTLGIALAILVIIVWG